MTGMLGNEAGYMLAGLRCVADAGRGFAWRQFYPDKAKIVQVDIDRPIGATSSGHEGVVGDVRRRWRRCCRCWLSAPDASFRSAYASASAKYREQEHAKRCGTMAVSRESY